MAVIQARSFFCLRRTVSRNDDVITMLSLSRMVTRAKNKPGAGWRVFNALS